MDLPIQLRLAMSGKIAVVPVCTVNSEESLQPASVLIVNHYDYAGHDRPDQFRKNSTSRRDTVIHCFASNGRSC